MKKNLIILLVCFISLNNIYAQRAGVIAAADAGGAVATAGSVASIAGWLAWTPAAPVMVLTLCVSGVVGGGLASYAVSRTNNVTPKNPKDIIIADYSFADNYFDEVGIIHNQILYDFYMKHGNTATPKVYYDFLIANKSKYGIKEIPVTLEYLEQLYAISKNFQTIQDINSYTLNNLPKEVDRNAYSNFLNQLSAISNKSEAITFIKRFEEKELKNKNYSELTVGTLAIYFSTYRHSLSLWQ